MTLEDGQLVAACCLPQPRRAIQAAGHDAVALRAEGRVHHAKAIMVHEDGQLVAACRLPHPRRAIIAGSQDAVALRAEGSVLHTTRMTLEDRSEYWLPYRTPERKCCLTSGRCLERLDRQLESRSAQPSTRLL